MKDVFKSVCCVALAALLCGGAWAGGRQDAAAHVAQEIPEEVRRRVKERHPRLYEPTFARVELARLPPEFHERGESAARPFKAGGRIAFRLLITNASTQKIELPLPGAYMLDRPHLLRDGEAVPYRADVAERVRDTDASPRSRSLRIEVLEPGQTLTQPLDLSDWYEPLRPGRYRLAVRRRFVWGGEWVETRALDFEVVK